MVPCYTTIRRIQVTIPNRRSLLAAPLLAAALVASGGAAASASTPVNCKYPLRTRRAPNLGSAKLRLGSRGTYVKNLQNLLSHAPKLKDSKGNWYKPCPLNEDGVFGSGTDAYVRDGQRALGLTPDGVVGPATKKAYYDWVG